MTVTDLILSNNYIRDKFKRMDYAQNFYAALCNNELIHNETEGLRCSWRGAASLVSQIFNEIYSSECTDYISFYCSGMFTGYNDEDILYLQEKNYVREGQITEEVLSDLELLGFKLVRNENDIDI